MQINTVIFDMDGLLIDSEPYWQEAGIETLQQFDVALTLEQYHYTTGLRTKEWIDYWFHYFNLDKRFAKKAEEDIVDKAIEKIAAHAQPMPGVDYIFDFFREKKFKIGLATSSPVALINVVAEKLGIGKYLNGYSSAELLPFSKPHPEVYLNCAQILQSSQLECICFEDSFNGMISVKAARMKCVVIPAIDQYELPKWGAADVKIRSLAEFGGELI
ncbi:MAG: hexitol phosphatase HxpB [Bacteroidetes bacterium]|nr:hexitol phosphatase HxpB [Bacteroidota bacterium]